MKKKLLNHRTLAEGEVTGHAHRASAGTLYEIEEGALLLESLEAWYASHEEHGAIQAPVHTELGRPTANYVRRIVQELDHASENARNVAD